MMVNGRSQCKGGPVMRAHMLYLPRLATCHHHDVTQHTYLPMITPTMTKNSRETGRANQTLNSKQKAQATMVEYNVLHVTKGSPLRSTRHSLSRSSSRDKDNATTVKVSEYITL